METDLYIHPAQVKILKSLLFKPRARFSELNKAKLTNDHFSFHINSLLEAKLIVKISSGKYRLTTKGKEFANRFDTIKEEIEKQAKIGALVVCIKRSGGKTKYLISQRLKQPYYGCYGFITGKVHWGETVLDSAERELKEETNLKANLKLVAIEHKMDYSQKGKLLEDKFFFVFKATKTKGKLKVNFEGGKNIWLTKKEILKLPSLFEGVIRRFELVKLKHLSFLETKYKVKKY
jgi:ADP-ribose pyrophosphatase YjhB (NUDIX family)